MDITFRCVWVNKYPGVGLPDQTPIILKPARVSSAPTLARFGRKQPSPSALRLRHPGARARPDGDTQCTEPRAWPRYPRSPSSDPGPTQGAQRAFASGLQ